MANPLIDKILDLVSNLLTQNKTAIVENVEKAAVTEVAKPVQPVAVEINDGIDWTNGAAKVSRHFTVREMLYLPTWKRLANEADGLDATVKANLTRLAFAMDSVRDYFDKSINVHVTYRPLEYNKVIHGALHSQHSVGLAMDFDVAGMTCGDAIRQINKDGMLEKWSMRCENNGENPSWVHLDLKPVPPGGNRYFKP
jgi:uncharacterized protein YcbK (DUF882 family)